MYWAIEKPENIDLTGVWVGRHKLADFKGVFKEGTEVLIAKSQNDALICPIYKVTNGKLKKVKDQGRFFLKLID
jgi:hypothetical protein